MTVAPRGNLNIYEEPNRKSQSATEPLLGARLKSSTDLVPIPVLTSRIIRRDEKSRKDKRQAGRRHVDLTASTFGVQVIYYATRRDRPRTSVAVAVLTQICAPDRPTIYGRHKYLTRVVRLCLLRQVSGENGVIMIVGVGLWGAKVRLVLPGFDVRQNIIVA